MANSVGRLLLVLLLCASTAPAQITSAQPIGRPNVPGITYTYRFHPIRAGQGRELVVAAAVALYLFNAEHNIHLGWPRIHSIVPLGASIASGASVFMMNRPFFVYRVVGRADVTGAGMYDDSGTALQWMTLKIYFAVWAGQLPLVQNAVPGSISAKFIPYRPGGN